VRPLAASRHGCGTNRCGAARVRPLGIANQALSEFTIEDIRTLIKQIEQESERQPSHTLH
jgi:hypothetical protein